MVYHRRITFAAAASLFAFAPLAIARAQSEPPPPEQPAVEKVWGWYAKDISLRFSHEAREKARELYDAGNANNLDRFCREEIRRLS